MGEFVRAGSRDKFYYFTAEIGEVFVPEGTLTEYTMESYERVFLSLLISLSALQTRQTELAVVELRRSYDEQLALLFNHGSDPIVTLLQATLWDRFDTSMSRPLWKSLAEDAYLSVELTTFAHARLTDIDQSPTSKKIGTKYRSSYHPLMYAKTLLRLPIGLTYGAIGVTSGIAFGASGCMLISYLYGDSQSVRAGNACIELMKVSGHIIKKSGDLVGYVLKPDLRHWKNMPSAIYITEEDTQETNQCLRTDATENLLTPLLQN